MTFSRNIFTGGIDRVVNKDEPKGGVIGVQL